MVGVLVSLTIKVMMGMIRTVHERLGLNTELISTSFIPPAGSIEFVGRWR
jgi:hypothetical protein